MLGSYYSIFQRTKKRGDMVLIRSDMGVTTCSDMGVTPKKEKIRKKMRAYVRTYAHAQESGRPIQAAWKHVYLIPDRQVPELTQIQPCCSPYGHPPALALQSANCFARYESEV